MMPNCLNRPCRRDNRCRSGVTFAECILATLVVGLMLAAALEALGTTSRIKGGESGYRVGYALANELMGEILAKEYIDPQTNVSFSLDAGETDGDRKTYDDVDDYNTLVESAVKDRTGNVRVDLSGWQRYAYVDPVVSGDWNTPVAFETGYKRILVKVLYDGAEIVSLMAVRTKESP